MSFGNKRRDADREYWLWRCAWCRRRIGGDQEVLTIPIKLRPEALREVSAGGIEQMLLAQEERTLALILVAQDSEAKREGTDAVIQFCSQVCAQTACDALRREMGLGGAGGGSAGGVS